MSSIVSTTPLRPSRREQLEAWLAERERRHQEDKQLKGESGRSLAIPQTTGKAVSTQSRITPHFGAHTTLSFATPMRAPKLKPFTTPSKTTTRQLATVPFRPIPQNPVEDVSKFSWDSSKSSEHYQVQQILNIISDGQQEGLTKPSEADLSELLESVKAPSAHWTVFDKIVSALSETDYEKAHSVFVEILNDSVSGEWAKARAFYWLFWAKLQEQFSLFDRAAELYEQAIKHRAKPMSLILAQLQRSAQIHRDRSGIFQLHAEENLVDNQETKFEFKTQADGLSDGASLTADNQENDLQEFERIEAEIMKDTDIASNGPSTLAAEEIDVAKSTNLPFEDSENEEPRFRNQVRRHRTLTPSRIGRGSLLGKAVRVLPRKNEENEAVNTYPNRVARALVLFLLTSNMQGTAANGGNESSLTKVDIRRVLVWLQTQKMDQLSAKELLEDHWDKIEENLSKTSNIIKEESLIQEVNTKVMLSSRKTRAQERKERKELNEKMLLMNEREIFEESSSSAREEEEEESNDVAFEEANDSTVFVQPTSAAEALRRYSQIVRPSVSAAIRRIEKLAESPAPTKRAQRKTALAVRSDKNTVEVLKYEEDQDAEKEGEEFEKQDEAKVTRPRRSTRKASSRK